METFSEFVLRAVSDYKLFVRKNFPAREAADRIKALGLKRMQLRNTDDLHLFAVGAKIIDELEKYVAKQERTVTTVCYFGASEFLRHLKSTINEYCVEDGNVIHVDRAASRAMIEAIQLVTLPEHKFTLEILEKLNKCINLVAKYGSMEHIALLNNAIKKNKKNITYFFAKYGKSLGLDNLLGNLNAANGKG